MKKHNTNTPRTFYVTVGNTYNPQLSRNTRTYDYAYDTQVRVLADYRDDAVDCMLQEFEQRLGEIVYSITTDYGWPVYTRPQGCTTVYGCE